MAILNTHTPAQQDSSGSAASRIEVLEARIAELIRENEQFTYIVSHDLQAPLRTVTGFLELIERRYADKLDESGKEFIDFALKGSQKLKSLVLDLLEFSRLNTSEFVFEHTELNSVLEEILAGFDEQIRNSGIKIVCHPLPEVYGNRKLIITLFCHLIDNAIKFRSEVSPQIAISANKSKKQIEIIVSDNGIGFDPVFLEKVFLVFRKLNTDEKRYPGNGKGLALCKKIAALHNWEISADTVSGQGTNIKIIIAEPSF